MWMITFRSRALDVAWRTSQGFVPTPTSAADAAALAATPTIVPTLALSGIPQSGQETEPPTPAATAVPSRTPTADTQQTKTPTWTPEPTDTPQAVAEIVTPAPEAPTAVPDTAADSEPAAFNWLWLAGGIVVLALAGVAVLQFQKRRG